MKMLPALSIFRTEPESVYKICSWDAAGHPGEDQEEGERLVATCICPNIRFLRVGFGLGVKGVSTPVEEVPTVDAPVPTPTHTSVSPPLTTTVPIHRRLDETATPSESGASADDRSTTSSSDDVGLSESVGTAPSARLVAPEQVAGLLIVVDAYGTESRGVGPRV
jgi:hypothetical protein